MEKKNGKIINIDFSISNKAEEYTTEENGSLDFDFDYEVDTMFNKLDIPQSKAEFLASQKD